MIDLNNVTLVSIDGIGKTDNHLKALKYSCKEIKFGDIKFFCPNNFGDKSFYKYISILPIDYDGYNQFCLTKLVDYIDTDYVLIVQDDGFIINPHLWNNDFLKYDYIGAPWPKDHLFFNSKRWPIVHQKLLESNIQYHVGNGGFSLRSKKLLNDVKNLYKPEYNNIPEDVLICIAVRKELENNKNVFAPFDIAKLFSCESIFVENFYANTKSTFGFHGRETHKAEVNKLNTIKL